MAQDNNSGEAASQLEKAVEGSGQTTLQEADLDPISFSQGMEMVMEKLRGWLEGFIDLLPNMLVALVVLMTFWFVGTLVFRTLNRYFRPRVQSDAVVLLFASTARTVVIVVAFLIALEMLGLGGTVKSLLAGVGILGIALGFALQDTLENYIIGLLMGIRKPLEIGDIVETNNHMGTVRDVNLRTTVIEDFLGQTIIIPNKDIYKTPLENYSKTGWRKLEFEIGTSYADDPEKVVKVATDALETLDFVGDRQAVEMYAMHFGDSSINFILRVRIAYPKTGYFSSRHKIITAIHRAYEENDVLIPWPIRTLDFNAKGGKPLDKVLPDSGPKGDE